MKSTKTMLLLTFYLTTTQISEDHTNQQTWVIKKIFFDETEKEQTERNKKKEEEILTQFRHDLKPIPQRDIDEITNTARKKLRQLWDHEDKNNDGANQILRSVIIEHVGAKTRIIAQNYTSNQEKIEHLTNSMVIKVHDRFIRVRNEDGSTPPPSGRALRKFFGDQLDYKIRTELQFNENRHGSGYQSQSYQRSETDNRHKWHPKNQTYNTSSHQYKQPENRNLDFTDDYLSTLDYELGSHLPNNDMYKIKNKMEHRLRRLRSLSYEEQKNAAIDYTKEALVELLEEQLNTYNHELHSIIINSSKLDDSIKETRRQIIAKINQLSEIEGNKIKNWFGNNLENIILDNMEIACPICSEDFKEEHRYGEVDRVILKAENQTQSCGHAVCTNCAQQVDKCPLCRAIIDRNDLDRKLYYPQPSAPSHGG